MAAVAKASELHIPVFVVGVATTKDTATCEGGRHLGPSRRDARGWEYTDSALAEVEVHGSWCGAIQSAMISDVRVIHACEGVIIR